MISINLISRVLYPPLQKKRYKYSESYLSVDYINVGDSYYSNQIKRLKPKNKIVTSNKIKIFDISGVKNISIFWFYLKFGKPMGTFFVTKSSRKIKILLYKMYLGDVKVKAEFHFYDKKLVFLKYIFPKVDKEEKKEILKGMSEKYLDGSDFDPNDTYIVDSKNTIISFYDGYELDIQYFTNLDFIQLIQNDKKKREEKQKRYKQRQYIELLSKL